MKNKKLIIGLIIVSPFVAAVVSLFMGAYAIAPQRILEVIASTLFSSNSALALPEKAIILDIRLPRILLASFVGAALSVSGATLQGIFRNPLVDPYILGISSGAAFGCALSIGFFPGLPIQVAALVFGMVAVVLAYFTARSQGTLSSLSLILSGVIVSAFFTALVSIIKFIVDPFKLQNIVYWLMGSFSLADWNAVSLAAFGIGAGLVPLLLMRWRLNVLSMGDDEARSLGVNVSRERVIFIALATVVVSLGVSLSGIIGWVGLIAPHLIRMVIGPDHKSLIPLSAAGGAAFMIVSDTIARNATSYDIPIGVITAVIGAPFFVYLMKKGGYGGSGR